MHRLGETEQDMFLLLRIQPVRKHTTTYRMEAFCMYTPMGEAIHMPMVLQE